jgi:sentrin-specific protease 1
MIGLFRIFEADAVVVDDFNMTVNGRHVQCLREGCWLNDEVMNFYFELLRARSECLVAEKKGQKCHFFNTFFYTQLAKTVAGYCYKNVQRWTRRLKSPLFTHDVVFAPIHVHDSHWCLAVMRLREKKIEYWDSLSGRDEGCLQVSTFLLDFLFIFSISLTRCFRNSAESAAIFN